MLLSDAAALPVDYLAVLAPTYLIDESDVGYAPAVVHAPPLNFVAVCVQTFSTIQLCHQPNLLSEFCQKEGIPQNLLHLVPEFLIATVLSFCCDIIPMS